MLSIIWSDKFSIGVSEIDDQHRRLFEFTEKLYEAAKTSNVMQSLMNYPDELIDYTKYHFLSEEKLVKDEDYPKYNMHKLEHDKLTKEALDFRISVVEGKTVDTNEFLKFLFSWLTKHIMDQDKKIGTYLQMKKLKKN